MAKGWDNTSELTGKTFSKDSPGSIEVKYPDKAFLITQYKKDKSKVAKYEIEIKFAKKEVETDNLDI